jgi:hypothetical protein
MIEREKSTFIIKLVDRFLLKVFIYIIIVQRNLINLKKKNLRYKDIFADDDMRMSKKRKDRNIVIGRIIK